MYRVYAQNLEERVKIPALTDTLRILFSEFGNVVDIVAKKNLKAKGQAFVVFETPESALEAINELQGFEVFDKPMKLSLAKTPSDKTVEVNCTEEALESHKRYRVAEKGKSNPVRLARRLVLTIAEKRVAAQVADEERQSKRAAGSATDGRPAKLSKTSGLKSTGATSSTVVPDEYLPPNKILFLQNVPDGYDVDGLTAIFGRFDGFREIRLVPGRRGIAFVEYDAEQGAITAKENTSGMKLGDAAIKVTYQRQ